MIPLGLLAKENGFNERSLEENVDYVIDQAKAAYNLKCAHEDPEALEGLERFVVLHSVDQLWQEHLYEMDGLRDAISNYRHAQKDPLVEYKVAAYDLFVGLMTEIKTEVLENLFRMTTKSAEEYDHVVSSMNQILSRDDVLSDLASGNQEAAAGIAASNQPAQKPKIELPKTVRRETPKVGRNEPCICGSGKKFKQCCGKA